MWVTLLTTHFEKPMAAKNFWTLLPFICQHHTALFQLKHNVLYFLCPILNLSFRIFPLFSICFPTWHTQCLVTFSAYTLSPWSSQTLIMKGLCCFNTLQTLIQPQCQIPEDLNHLHILCQEYCRWISPLQLHKHDKHIKTTCIPQVITDDQAFAASWKLLSRGIPHLHRPRWHFCYTVEQSQNSMRNSKKICRKNVCLLRKFQDGYRKQQRVQQYTTNLNLHLWTCRWKSVVYCLTHPISRHHHGLSSLLSLVQKMAWYLRMSVCE